MQASFFIYGYSIIITVHVYIYLMIITLFISMIVIYEITFIVYMALCQMLGYSPYESSLAPIIFMVGAILFAQK